MRKPEYTEKKLQIIGNRVIFYKRGEMEVEGKTFPQRTEGKNENNLSNEKGIKSQREQGETGRKGKKNELRCVVYTYQLPR